MAKKKKEINSTVKTTGVVDDFLLENVGSIISSTEEIKKKKKKPSKPKEKKVTNETMVNTSNEVNDVIFNKQEANEVLERIESIINENNVDLVNTNIETNEVKDDVSSLVAKIDVSDCVDKEKHADKRKYNLVASFMGVRFD